MFEGIPPHILRLRFITATQAALAWSGIDPMRVDSLWKAEQANWIGWEEAKSNHIAILQVVALGELQAVSATVFIVRNSFGDGDEETIDPSKITINDLDHLCEVTLKTGEVFKWLSATNGQATTSDLIVENSGNTKIKSETYAKLTAALEAFPIKYPNYKSTPPKLNEDVRAWLVEEFECDSNRQAHVFGTIISEHFDLK